MDALNMKHVDFDKFCQKCKHENKEVYEDPCFDCLSVPARQYSHKPEKFEEKGNGHVNG